MTTPTLSQLAIALGLLLALPQVYGLLSPAGFARSARAFPRSTGWGWLLMLAGTAWFVWNLSEESIADFAAWKDWLLAAFAAIGIGSCLFVQDFLAVRGLAVVFLLVAKMMVDAGRTKLGHTPWVVVFQAWAYCYVVAGMWFTIAPYRLRDLIAWGTASEGRVRLLCGLRLAFGLFIAVLGYTRFN